MTTKEQATDTYGNTVTDKQREFIGRLFVEHTGPTVERLSARYAELLAAGQVTKANASLLIDHLLKEPKTKQQSSQPKPSGGGYRSKSDQLLVESAKVPLGYYSRHLKDGTRQIVQVYDHKFGYGNKRSRRFAKQLYVYGHGRARWLKLGWASTQADLVPLSVEDAQAIGRLHGVCAVCGRALSDPASVQLGIGPVCFKRLSRQAITNLVGGV